MSSNFYRLSVLPNFYANEKNFTAQNPTIPHRLAHNDPLSIKQMCENGTVRDIRLTQHNDKKRPEM